MKTKIVKIANIAAAILVIVTMVMTFVPCWVYTDQVSLRNEETGKWEKHDVVQEASVSGYLWFPRHHKGLTRAFQAQVGYAYNSNEYVISPLAMTVLCVLIVIYLLRHLDSMVVPLMAIAFGLVSIFSVLGNSVISIIMHTGSNWFIYIILGAAVTVCGVVGAIYNIPVMIHKFKVSSY